MSTKYRRARKAHRCGSCGSTIPSGATYRDRRTRARFGEAVRDCLACVDAEQRERDHQDAQDDMEDKGGHRTIVVVDP